MPFQRIVVYAATHEAELEDRLNSLCETRVYECFESFLMAIASAEVDCIAVLVDNDARRVGTAIAAVRAASAWGRPGIRHFLTVALGGAGARDVVASFRAGCDGFIRLPTNERHVLRGLPVELRKPQAPAVPSAGAWRPERSVAATCVQTNT